MGKFIYCKEIISWTCDVICDIAIYADDTTLYSKSDQASDLWQQLELASELKSDLRDTVDWGKKWLVDFNAGKTQLVSFDRSNSNGSIDLKMDGSALKEISSFKMVGLTFSSSLDWGSYCISVAKTLIRSLNFFLLRLLYVSMNLPYTHVWNTIVTSGLVPLIATRGTSPDYAGLLVLHLLFLLNPWLIIEM